jgi:hypothetical protein
MCFYQAFVMSHIVPTCSDGQARQPNISGDRKVQEPEVRRHMMV